MLYSGNVFIVIIPEIDHLILQIYRDVTHSLNSEEEEGVLVLKTGTHAVFCQKQLNTTAMYCIYTVPCNV